MRASSTGDEAIICHASARPKDADSEALAIDMGDKRLSKRAVLLAERLAASPSKIIPGACHGWAEVAVAYRFIKNPSVAFWQSMKPHVRCTHQRM